MLALREALPYTLELGFNLSRMSAFVPLPCYQHVILECLHFNRLPTDRLSI